MSDITNPPARGQVFTPEQEARVREIVRAAIEQREELLAAAQRADRTARQAEIDAATARNLADSWSSGSGCYSPPPPPPRSNAVR